jgi:hypothetical protein
MVHDLAAATLKEKAAMIGAKGCVIPSLRRPERSHDFPHHAEKNRPARSDLTQ